MSSPSHCCSKQSDGDAAYHRPDVSATLTTVAFDLIPRSFIEEGNVSTSQALSAPIWVYFSQTFQKSLNKSFTHEG